MTITFPVWFLYVWIAATAVSIYLNSRIIKLRKKQNELLEDQLKLQRAVREM